MVGVGQVELGLPLGRLIAGQRRLRFRKLGLQHVDLPARCFQPGLIPLDRGARRGRAGRRGLGVLHAAVAGGGEGRVALVVLVGECGVGLIDPDRCAGGLDRGPLRLDRSLFGQDRRRGGGDVGLGLVEGDPEVAVVDLGQRLARLHRLVVADQNLGHVARDLGRDRRGVGLDIGVVGRHLEPADRPVLPAEIADGGESGRASGREQRPAQRGPRDQVLCEGRRPPALRSTRAPPRRLWRAGRLRTLLDADS